MKDLEKAKHQFEKLCQDYLHSEKDIEYFMRFVNKTLKDRMNEYEEQMTDSDEDIEEKNSKLTEIIQLLKDSLGLYSESPAENIHFPIEGRFSGYNHNNTIHTDAFLYSDEEIDEMQRKEMIPSSYCVDCGSNNIKPINMISHSFSIDELASIFSKNVLGRYDLSKKVIMDVGSRLGSTLYYVFYFTPVKKIIGVEINTFFANLQKKIVSKYNMQKRVQVIENDVLNLGQLINKECDILIMHNVFEFFCERDNHAIIWKKLKSDILRKKGLLLLCCPSIEQSMTDAGILDISIQDWVKEVPLVYCDDHIIDEERFSEIRLYEVI